MSERDSYPTGVPCWVDTLQPDPRAAVDFYGELFGWRFEGPGAMAGNPAGEYFVARVGESDVAGVGSRPPEGPPPEAAWITHVRTDSADAAAERARDAGGAVLVEPFDAPPAGRLAVLADPAGAVFCAWEAGDREGAQRVNEPGAWAMSALVTGDPEGAKAFYGAVFGWETEGFQVGEDEFFLFRLPGYVGGEPEQPVARDVVAAMAPAPPGTAAHWSVDFWVDDVDAAAARAASHGGGIVVEPQTTPLGREATLADPAGATFTVTRIAAAG